MPAPTEPTPPPQPSANPWRYRSVERLAQLLEVRRAPRFLIPLLFLLDLVLVLTIGDVVAATPLFRWLIGVSPLFASELFLNLLILALEVGALLLFVRIRPRDIRRDRWQLEKGVLFGLALFDAVLVVLLAFSMLTGSSQQLQSFLDPNSAGRWLLYVIGVALSEEVLYRWFFLGQFFQHIRIANTRQRLAWALIGSQFLFALIHLPTRLNVMDGSLERLPFELFGLFAFGVLYSLVYLQTGSLFAAIAAHALVDIVIEASGTNPVPRLALTVAILVFTALWPFMARGQFRSRARGSLAKT